MARKYTSSSSRRKVRGPHERKRVPIRSDSASASPPEGPAQANATLAKRARKKLSEAMRDEGLDETRLAQGYKVLVQRVEKSDDDLKIHLDVLKECSKQLEEAQGGRPAPARPGAPVIVQLIHNVARPERKPPADRVPASDSPPAPDT